MLKARLLLEKKLNTLPETKKKQFLLDCIEKNTKQYSKLQVKTQLKEALLSDNVSYTDLVCKICNKYNFVRDNYTETCKDCGYTRDLIPTEKTFEKVEYIKRGSNLVKITKDSRKITVDLNKINEWLKDSDPYARDIKIMIDNLETIYQSKGIDLPKSVQNTSISLLYNFNELYKIYDGSHKKLYNKKAVSALCVYYGSSINNNIVSLQQLSILFNVNISEIIVTNTLFKDIFKNTDYFKYLNLREQINCDIQLSMKNKILFDKIKSDLIKNFPNIKEPIDNVEYSAIIYFITNKLNTVIKYTLKTLEEKCNVSTTSIGNKSKAIENFYKNNPKLYKELKALST